MILGSVSSYKTSTYVEQWERKVSTVTIAIFIYFSTNKTNSQLVNFVPQKNVQAVMKQNEMGCTSYDSLVSNWWSLWPLIHAYSIPLTSTTQEYVNEHRNNNYINTVGLIFSCFTSFFSKLFLSFKRTPGIQWMEPPY